MKTMSGSPDDLFRNAVLLDNPGIEPDKAIESRLNYYYALKRSSGKVHANSFLGMFAWAFSLKSIGLKVSLISGCLAYFLFVGNIGNNPGINELSDTCQVYQLPLDSNYVVKDTCK